MEAKKLTKKDLWKVFRGQFTIRGANSYERQQNVGFTQATMPVIEKVYDNDGDKREACERHIEYLLTNDATSAIPVGVTMTMEGMHVSDPDMDPNAINAVKAALTGPLAGLGDSLLNGTARPVLVSPATSLIHANLGWVGPIFFVIGMGTVSLSIHCLGVFQGYKWGIKLVGKVNSGGLISRIIDIVAITVYTIVGGLIPAPVAMNIPIEIGSGETVINIQKTLNDLVPGVLNLTYTFLIYYLVMKKKNSAVKLIFLTMVFAIFAAYVGILGQRGASMMDIHSHLKTDSGEGSVQKLLQDMGRFHVNRRVIPDMHYDDVRNGNQRIAELVKEHPERLIGCTMLSPALSTTLEDTRHACLLREIHTIEFDSYRHGYAPDDYPVLGDMFAMLQERDLPAKVSSSVDAKALPHQWESYIRRCPQIPFIYLHMGHSDYGYSCVDIVKRNKSVYVETGNQYEVQILRKASWQLHEEQTMFGTTYPQRLTKNAVEMFDLFDLKEDQLQMFTDENGKRLLQM